MRNTKKFLGRMVLLLAAFTLLLASTAFAKATPKLAKKKVTLTAGQTYTLSLKNNKKKVTWKTSDKKVVALSKKSKKSVRLTAKKEGKATVTAVIGKKKYTCTVAVNNAATNDERPDTVNNEQSSPQDTEQPSSQNTGQSTEQNTGQQVTFSPFTAKGYYNQPNEEGGVKGNIIGFTLDFATRAEAVAAADCIQYTYDPTFIQKEMFTNSEHKR